VMASRSAATLREELTETNETLTALLNQFQRARRSDDPKDLRRCLDLEPKISHLRAHVATLPKEIERAEAFEKTLLSARIAHRERHNSAERLLRELLDALESITTDRALKVFRLCAEANQLRAVVSTFEPDAQLPRALDARVACRRALDEVYLRLGRLTPESIRPNPCKWAEELNRLSNTAATEVTPIPERILI
jgi:hypothetical protein